MSLIHPGFSNFDVWLLVPLQFEFFISRIHSFPYW